MSKKIHLKGPHNDTLCGRQNDGSILLGNQSNADCKNCLKVLAASGDGVYFDTLGMGQDEATDMAIIRERDALASPASHYGKATLPPTFLSPHPKSWHQERRMRSHRRPF